MSEKQNIPLQPFDAMSVDKHRSVEKSNAQIHAAVQFAHYIVNRYPQVDDMHKIVFEVDEGIHVELPPLPEGIQAEPQLNYYLAGSLATMLLSQAETIELCEETNGAHITIVRSLANPVEVRSVLTEFARPIGDLDYVSTAHYKALLHAAQDTFGSVSNEVYQQNKRKYLGKGGGGPSFDELPKEALSALKEQPGSLMVMCDPVEVYGTNKFARVTIDGQQYYLTRPDTIIAYKTLHMLQSYDQKPEKFNSDFVLLHKALLGLYTEEELVKLTHQIVSEYENSMAQISTIFRRVYKPKFAQLAAALLARQDVAPESRDFIEKVLVYDQAHS